MIEAYKVRDLRSTHERYDEVFNEWVFLLAAYEGVKSLVELGVVRQHEREDGPAYLRRMSELYGFNFSKIVIDIVNFYLFKKESRRTLPASVATDSAWQSFMSDCNRQGDAFSDFIADQARWAAVIGHVGLLVDKPNVSAENRAEEQAQGIYPYLSAYHPPSILDWTYQRDSTGKVGLTYLKLKDDCDDLNRYRLWWPDHWEVYVEPENDGVTALSGEEDAVLESSGENPLGEIPFTYLYNVRGRRAPFGVSDIHEVARIDLSVIRDLSQIGEIIGYNAFPMLLAPMFEEGKDIQDDVGPRAVYEFDPERPEAKPEWMIPAAEGSLRAIWDGITKKASEIYRIANAGGLQAQGSASVSKSGTALAAEFQQLNAKITQKAINAENAENMVLYFWLRWQGMDRYIVDSKIERSRDYDVHNLAQDLADALTSKTIVRSETFKREVEKQVARSVLPCVEDNIMRTIDEEIDSTEPITFPDEEETEFVIDE